jgi:hypothetical protein
MDLSRLLAEAAFLLSPPVQPISGFPTVSQGIHWAGFSETITLGPQVQIFRHG